MQHHAHIARTAPPHMRAHHMAVPPLPHSQSQTHMPPLNRTHAPPPVTGQQSQMSQNHHQQQQSQLVSNGTVLTGDSAGMISSSSAMRDHQTRLNQQPLPQRQHQHPQSLHTTTQLQKLRQQHQHINNNNNNNNINSTNKNSYHHQQQQQQQQQQPRQYNGASNTHGNVLPVQSVIQQQQQPQQILHHQTSSHQNQNKHQQQPTIYHQPQQQQHLRAATSMAPQQSVAHLQQQQTQPKTTTQQQPQQQHQPTLNPANKTTHHIPVLTALNSSATISTTQSSNNTNSNNVHKLKYNNNIGGSNAAATASGVGGGGMVPISILQNPNRISKTQQNSAATPNKIELNKAEPKKVSLVDNKISSSSFGAELVKAAPVATVNENQPTVVTVGQDNFKIVQRDATKDANKENVKGVEQNPNITSDAKQSDTEKDKNSNILSNIDSNVSKNSREKTPMCHVNELARFNKIIHQYRLTSEKGPAHCKRFTVTLKLGDEEYTAEGFKIKKAQHLAAADALANTKYKHPVPKVMRRNIDGEGNSSRSNITPTVELNALAMKLGQQTYYLLDPRQNTPTDASGGPLPTDSMMPTRFGGTAAPPHLLPPHGMSGAGHMINQHAPPHHLHMMDPPGYARRNGPYTGGLPPMHGGPHVSSGSYMPPRYGPPPQHAHISKYNTHQRYPLMPPPHVGGGPHSGMPPPPHAYSQPPHHHHHPHHAPHLRYYGMHGVPTRVTLVVGKQKFIGSGHTLQQAKHDAAARALQVLKVQATEQQNEELNNSQEENDKKSPISMVHEIAIQRGMTVHFKVLREEGPAHMKKFVTACIVGKIVAEGEGNGKKTSKKRAAENMLEELRKLPPLTPTKMPVKRIKGKTSSKGADGAEAATGGGRGRSSGGGGDGGNERRKRGSASIKEKTEVDADADNPITRLTQLQQNRKEKDPVFEFIEKNGNESSRRREFIVEVTASGKVARGTGNSKKLAKRNAAQNLLLAMGINDGDSIEAVASTNNTPTVDKEKPEAAIGTTAKVAENNIKSTSILEPIAELANCRKVPLVSTPAGKVPGILILRQNKKHAARKKEGAGNATIDDSLTQTAESSTATITEESTILPAPTVKDNNANGKVAATVTAVTAKPTVVTTTEVSNNVAVNNTSNTSDVTTASSSSTNTTKSVSMHMKEQLLYLAKLMGFEVNFSDYPKGVHSEFLTIVTLSTNPPQICHGVGISIEESQNDAARNALKILSELGLNNAAK